MKINIVQLDRNAQDGGVITVHWTASKAQDQYTASSYGAESFTPDPESPDFVPFDQLLEQDVVDWLKTNQEWLDDLEARLDADIKNQQNPPVLQGLPWENDTTVESE